MGALKPVGGPRLPAIPVSEEISLQGGVWSAVWQHEVLEGQHVCVTGELDFGSGTGAGVKGGSVSVSGQARRRTGESVAGLTSTSTPQSADIPGLDCRVEAIGNTIRVEVMATNPIDVTVDGSLVCRCRNH